MKKVGEIKYGENSSSVAGEQGLTTAAAADRCQIVTWANDERTARALFGCLFYQPIAAQIAPLDRVTSSSIASHAAPLELLPSTAERSSSAQVTAANQMPFSSRTRTVFWHILRHSLHRTLVRSQFLNLQS